MAKKTTSQWFGGLSSNSRSGLASSWRFAKNLNIYNDDDSVSLNPIPVKVSGSVVLGVGKWMVDVFPSASDKYGYDDGGNIYKITSSDVFTLDRASATIGNGAAGQGLGYLDNALYYTTATTLGRKYPLSGTPAYNDDLITDGTLNLDLSVTASGNTYAVPAAISETSTNKCTIVPTTDPLKTISVWVTAKGTGNWTVTVHDAGNNNLGSATVSNASLTNGAMNSFTITTPVRINIGETYHFHATSSVADGTLQSGTSNDLETAQYNTYFGILISDTQYHAIIQHTNGTGGTIVIGNANYMATWDGVTYQPNQIEITPGYNIRYFVRENEFIVAMAWKGTNIDDYEDGKAFWWDGISPYYNYSKPVTGGQPNASLNYKNRILSVLGSNGNLTLGTEPFKTIQPAPLLARGKKVEIIPGAMTTWQGRAHIGMAYLTDDGTGFTHGVYEFGNNSDRAVSYTSVSTEVLNLGYTISTGDTQGTTMKIGCVAGFGNSMYIWWKSQASTYGVDKVSKTSNPATSGSYESLIDDDTVEGGNLSSAPQKLKEASRLTIYYDTLPAGCTITPKYRLNRATSWTTGTTTDIGIAGTRQCIMDIHQRYYEIEYGFDIVATTNYPLILGMLYEFEPNTSERDTGIL